MSAGAHDETADSADPAGGEPRDTETREELAAEVAVLREENQRLRDEYLRAQQQIYRRSAVGLLGIGLLALLGGLVFVDARTVLFALGGTGVFAGVLTYVLTPERFISETVSGAVFDAMATDREAIRDELGLTGTPLYLPTDGPTLFIPRTRHALTDVDIPAAEALSSFFVVDSGSGSGIAMTPTGGPLYTEVQKSVSGELAPTPQRRLEQLVDGLVEGFELIDGADISIDRADGRATVALSGVAYGSIDRIDHPVSSLLATGLSAGLETPVEATVSSTDPPTVTYRWDPDDDALGGGVDSERAAETSEPTAAEAETASEDDQGGGVDGEHNGGDGQNDDGAAQNNDDEDREGSVEAS